MLCFPGELEPSAANRSLPAGTLPVLPLSPLSPLLAQSSGCCGAPTAPSCPVPAWYKVCSKLVALVAWEDVALARGTVVSPARCLQELHGSLGTAQGCRAHPRDGEHSPGVQGTAQGCRHSPGVQGTTQGCRHSPGVQAQPRDGEHSPGVQGTAQGCRHSPGVQAQPRGAGHSPGVQGTAQGWRAPPRGAGHHPGVLFAQRPRCQDTPLEAETPLLSQAGAADVPGERYSLALQHSMGLAGPGWEWGALSSRRGTKPGEHRHPCGHHDRSALGPELGCRWTHKVWQKVTRSLHHPPKQSPLPMGVLQAKAQQCWLPQRAELSWKSKYRAPQGQGEAAVLWDTGSTHPRAGMGCPSAKGNSSEMLAGETGGHGRKESPPAG
ncbi:uncharacterized protein LOC131093491 [Melospiza georgiana]|uniref:uncharacterized protein LOC131093491 n=1 Tax=Melospiza georgiana TaxID=44398 RepID=UPI0025AD98DE|nr:uncharacterized protein LOC131093491 [Melospiza georgiana]